MQTIFNSKVKETLYIEKLKNGLTVMIICWITATLPVEISGIALPEYV